MAKSSGDLPSTPGRRLRVTTVECGYPRGLVSQVTGVLATSRRVAVEVARAAATNGSCPDLEAIAADSRAGVLLILLPEDPFSLPWLEQLAAQACAVPRVAASECAEPELLFELGELGLGNVLAAPVSAGSLLPRLWRLAEPLDTAPDRRVRRPAEDVAADLVIPGLIGASPAFREQVAKIPLLARSRAGVLIRGETGTGKELIARAIHEAPGGGRGRFVPVNCGAIPTELVESELFGHGRSAFTGAQVERGGLVEEAAGGTLFLDEVDSLPLAAQVKLLRFLQDKEFRRLGSTQTRHSDARVIAATNGDVERAVESGRLRRDLYYRLNVVPIDLPPLRERREDIPLLVQHFVAACSRDLRRPAPQLGPGVLESLLAHDWPGNVRELEHLIHRAMVLADGRPRLDRRDLQPARSAPERGATSFKEAKAHLVARFERSYVSELLRSSGGNITQAASHAGKNRRAFFELIRKHGIDAGEFRGGG